MSEFIASICHREISGSTGDVEPRFASFVYRAGPEESVSECRNKSLQLMFQQIGGGEKAGSSIDKIRQGWASQKWRGPLIEEQYRPDRVGLTLPMASLLPEESLARLRAVLGDPLGGLGPEEIQALVTADVEGRVTNPRLQQLSRQHAADITKMLQDLVSKGLLVRDGYGRWALYRLSPSPFASEGASSHHNGRSSPNSPPGSPLSTEEERPELQEIARPSREKGRLQPEETEQIILQLCQGRFLTYRQIGELLARDPRNTRDRFLSKMVQEGKLRARYPNDLTHPHQAYTTSSNPGIT